MSPRVRAHLRPMLAIVGLAVIALAVAGYIVREQRLRLFFDDDYTVAAEFSSGQALTPGQGQAVTVAGVKVGEIAKVSLRDGRAVVELRIERDRLPAVHADATMLIRPRTQLQDMTIDVDPGSAKAPELGPDDVLGVERTTPEVNLDEVLAVLDTDVRDWATTLVGGLGDGVRDKGEALRAAFKASAPTLRSTRRLAEVVQGRRKELARAMHSLRQLTEAVGREDDAVATLVAASERTFSAVAGEDAALREGLRRLPGTLQAARDALDDARPFARAAAPALEALLPAVRQAPATLRAVDPLVREGRGGVTQLRGLSREAREPVRDLAAATVDLREVTPELTDAFKSLRYATNLLAYNPEGKEEGLLFWASWFLHNGHSFQSGQDANGPFWRGSIATSCSSLVNSAPLQMLFGPFLSQVAAICPTSPQDG